MKLIPLLKKHIGEQAFATDNPDVDYTVTSTGSVVSKPRVSTPTTSKGSVVGSKAKLSTSGNSKKVIDYFTSKGLEPHQSAGIAANFEAESRFNPSAIGDQGEAHGLAQWRDSRWENLQKFAKQKGKKWSDFDLQLDFAWQEMNDSYQGMLSDLKNAKDSNEATKVVMLQYEIPSDRRESAIERRQKIANKYFSEKTSSRENLTPITSDNPFQFYPLKKSLMSAPTDGQGWGDCRGKDCNRKHAGLDFEAKVGTPIYAPFDGVITKVDSTGLSRCGKSFTLTKSAGETTWAIRTCHCNSINVSQGESVKAGEVIATVGGTGHGRDGYFGSHLHLELYKNGSVIDPSPYLSSAW